MKNPKPKETRKIGKSHVSSYELVRETKDEVVVRFCAVKGAFKIILKRECKNTKNIYRIMRGRVKRCDNGLMFGEGDIIVAKDIQEDIILDVLEDTEFFWTTSPEVFGLIDDESSLIMENLEEIQKKDSYTRDHTLRVNSLAKRLALKHGMKGQDIAYLSLAALAHDLGKINISDALLLKPGKLTDEEFDMMKLHVNQSYELIKDHFPKAVSDIVIQHHERLNGSGYPYGLMEKDICIAAKIISIADSYDAMTSNRPYKKARTKEAALEELIRESGRLFDGDLVGIFVRYIDEIDLDLRK